MPGDILFNGAIPWIAFTVFVVAMLAIDLGVFHRNAHELSRREALAWSAVWIGLALAFNAGVYAVSGFERGLEWTTGFLIEESLSVDNVFVFLLIFSAFGVPAIYQHRVLFWGIVGALVMRGALILIGGALLESFHWAIHVFGGLLILAGIRTLRDQHRERDPRNSRVLKVARRFIRTTEAFEDERFWVRKSGVRYATPLFLVLLLIETTDLFFALDSIPAIYGVADDPFIVYTSNIFAILGLRALYFVVGGYLRGLRYLTPALATILVFIGVKMVLVRIVEVPALLTLAVIVGILVVAVVASLRGPPPPDRHAQTSPREEHTQRSRHAIRLGRESQRCPSRVRGRDATRGWRRRGRPPARVQARSRW